MATSRSGRFWDVSIRCLCWQRPARGVFPAPNDDDYDDKADGAVSLTVLTVVMTTPRGMVMATWWPLLKAKKTMAAQSDVPSPIRCPGQRVDCEHQPFGFVPRLTATANRRSSLSSAALRLETIVWTFNGVVTSTFHPVEQRTSTKLGTQVRLYRVSTDAPPQSLHCKWAWRWIRPSHSRFSPRSVQVEFVVAKWHWGSTSVFPRQHHSTTAQHSPIYVTDDTYVSNWRRHEATLKKRSRVALPSPLSAELREEWQHVSERAKCDVVVLRHFSLKSCTVDCVKVRLLSCYLVEMHRANVPYFVVCRRVCPHLQSHLDNCSN